MGVARAWVVGEKGHFECLALVDSGSWHTIVDEGLANGVGIRYTGLEAVLTSFSGHRVVCREAIVNAVAVEGKQAPFELVAVCRIAPEVKELLKKHGACEEVVIGVHTLERLGLAVDPATHRLVESPGILMI